MSLLFVLVIQKNMGTYYVTPGNSFPLYLYKLNEFFNCGRVLLACVACLCGLWVGLGCGLISSFIFPYSLVPIFFYLLIF